MLTSRYSMWIDASNHNPVTPEIIAAAKAQGKSGICFNLLDIYPQGIRQQLSLARDSGMRLAGYVYLNFPGGKWYSGLNGYQQTSSQVKEVLDGDFKLEWIAIDCEDEGSTLSGKQSEEFIAGAVSVVEFDLIPCRIYTAQSWWITNTGNTNRFARLGLWNADNDGVADLSLVDYGGWTHPIMEQDSFHLDVAGTEYDEDIEEEPDIPITVQIAPDQSAAIAELNSILHTYGGTVGQQDGQYIGVETGGDTPPGYTDYRVRVKKG